MLYYVVCWTETGGIYSCGHEHPSIAEAMECLVADGRTFIRAREHGVLRSLSDAEAEVFASEVRKKYGRE